MYSPLTRLVNGHSKHSLLSTFRLNRTDVHAIQLSMDGTLLAIGNDNGELEVCDYSIALESPLTLIPDTLKRPWRQGVASDGVVQYRGCNTLSPLAPHSSEDCACWLC